MPQVQNPDLCLGRKTAGTKVTAKMPGVLGTANPYRSTNKAALIYAADIKDFPPKSA